MPATTRLALPYPAGTDPADVPADLQDLAEALDGAALDDQGLLSARPVSTPGSPGIRGRYFWATDQAILYRDHGTGWTTIYDALIGRRTRVALSAPQTVTSTNEVPFNRADEEGLGAAEAGAGSKSRIRVPVAGLYLVEAQLFVGDNATAVVRQDMNVVGGTLSVLRTARRWTGAANQAGYLQVAFTRQLPANELVHVEIWGSQAAVGIIGDAASYLASSLALTKVGPSGTLDP